MKMIYFPCKSGGDVVCLSIQDSPHYQFNGFRPPKRKPLASLQAYLSNRQHSWTLLSSGKVWISCCHQDGLVSCCHSCPSSSSLFVHNIAKRLCLACHAVALFYNAKKSIIKSPRKHVSDCFCIMCNTLHFTA